MAENKNRVLFVCTGNTCRSPMAAALLLRLWKGAPRPEVFSAGLAAADGERASPHARAVMREAGADLEAHLSTLLEGDQVGRATLILVMGRWHRDELLRRFPEAAAKTFLLKDFAGIDGGGDLLDPYGGTIDDYRQTFAELRSGIEKIVQILGRSAGNEDSTGQ